MAEVDCVGVYEVEAGSEEEAREKWRNWNGDDEVTFSHYAEEMPDEIVSVRED
jgi:hypothetical protein